MIGAEITPGSTVVVTGDQVSSDVGGEVAILDLGSGRYYGLGAVGARVWELVQTPRTVHEVEVTLLSEYEVEARRCREDLVSLLDDLAGRGLLRVENEPVATS